MVGGMYMIHRLCCKITECNYIQSNYQGMDLEKISLGLEIFLENITKAIIVLLIAWKLGIVVETVIAILTFAILRLFTFGMHSKSSIVCTVVSIGIDVLTPLVVRNIGVNTYVFIIIMFSCSVLLFLYAPADTEKHPLIGKKRRARLKKSAVITSLLLVIVGLISGMTATRSIIMFMEMYVVIGILPITYKLFKRRYNNYEGYE